jgi:hypothetical protein
MPFSGRQWTRRDVLPPPAAQGIADDGEHQHDAHERTTILQEPHSYQMMPRDIHG